MLDERAHCQPGSFTDFTCTTWTCVLQACRATQLTTVCSCFSIMKSIYCGKHCIFVLSFTLILTEMQGVELPGFIGRLVHLYHGAILVFSSLLSCKLLFMFLRMCVMIWKSIPITISVMLNVKVAQHTVK